MNVYTAAMTGVFFIIMGCGFIAYANTKGVRRYPPSPESSIASPPPTAPGMVYDQDGTMHAETTLQRYLRTEAEWRRLNQLVSQEKTDLKVQADKAFRDYMNAESDLKFEAKKPMTHMGVGAVVVPGPKADTK